MNILKKIMLYVLMLILAVSIVVFIAVNYANNTIMKENYILSKVEQSNYYVETYELVKSNLENYIEQSGIDVDVIKNSITIEQVKQDTRKILKNVYNGLSEEISTDELKITLKENILKSLGDRKLTESEEASIDQFIVQIIDEYSNTILHTKYENSISKIYEKAKQKLNLIMKIMIVTLSITIIIVVLLNINDIYKSIAEIGISSLSSGCIILIFCFMIKNKINLSKLYFFNKGFANVLRDILAEYFDTIMFRGIIFIILGLTLVVFSNLISNLKKYKINRGKLV